MSSFHSLAIKEIRKETADAVSITFDVPEALAADYNFIAGQYITLKTTIKDTEVRRAYSICTTPESKVLKVAVKAVENGTFSVYANESLKSGTVLDVHIPEGKFTYSPSTTPETIAAFAAGSGITPIMSIVKTALAANKEVVLVYGNKTPKDTIFYDELMALQRNYPNHFTLQLVYSQANEDNAIFGRIEASTVNYILNNKCKGVDFNAFYLCGPEAMITTVSDTLKGKGISDDAIRFELFTSSETETTTTLEGKSQISIVVDEETFSLEIDKNTIILDAALAEDIDAPYSCQGGICSSCIARVTEGKVDMQNNQILTDSELAEGLILTCQARPITATVAIDYDDI